MGAALPKRRHWRWWAGVVAGPFLLASKVERSHRIDAEEFWNRQRPANYEAAVVALRDWEQTYNYERFSLALKGRTPAERLGDFRAAA